MDTGARLWIVAGLASVLAASCVESHVQTDPLALPAFCEAFFDAMCDPLAQCDCGAEAEALCRAQEAELCAGFPSAAMLRAVEESRLAYDGAAAAALVDRMQRRAASCESFVDAIDWRVRDLFSVGGVFTGTVPAGAPCEVLGFELISECALGSCTPIDGAHVCRTVVGAGARCDATHQCADLDAPLTIDLGIEGLTLRCVGGESGTCEPRVPAGGSCALASDCASGLCLEGRCELRALGEACATSRECTTAYCSGATSTCARGDLPEGAACDEAAACASHVCTAGACLPAGCGTF